MNMEDRIKPMTDKMTKQRDDCQYDCPSIYGKEVERQIKMQPKYAEPGLDTGEMIGEHRNVQAGA